MRPAIVRALGGALTASLLAITIPTVRVASAGGPTATAYFAGGCYWGVEAVFRHVRGVKHATSGFAVPVTSGPASADPNAPNYVEAVKVEYDPSQVTYQQLLQVFFLVAHDPTEVNAQGPDIGPEYRSMVFVSDSAQRRAVESYIAELTADKSFPAPIATQVGELLRFREAPADQQDYVAKNRATEYVTVNDLPKLEQLKTRFATLYRN